MGVLLTRGRDVWLVVRYDLNCNGESSQAHVPEARGPWARQRPRHRLGDGRTLRTSGRWAHGRGFSISARETGEKFMHLNWMGQEKQSRITRNFKMHLRQVDILGKWEG